MSSLPGEGFMPGYKTLKSVAFNFGHSFRSLMNFYAMQDLIAAAKCGKGSVLLLDILSGSWNETSLISPGVEESLISYCKYFPKLVTSSNSAMKLIKSAKMRMFINPSQVKEYSPADFWTYFELTVEIIDNRGKKYLAEFNEYW